MVSKSPFFEGTLSGLVSKIGNYGLLELFPTLQASSNEEGEGSQCSILETINIDSSEDTNSTDEETRVTATTSEESKFSDHDLHPM